MDAQVTESAKMYEFLAWLEFNRKRIILVASVLAAILLIISYYRYHANQLEIAANQALFRLGLPISRDEQSPPPTANAYLKVAAQYAGTETAKRAQLMAAGAYFNENNYTAALDQFRKFLEKNRGTPLGGIAAIGVAACLDAQDRTDDALKTYQEVVAQYPGDTIVSQARLSMARIYEAKKQPEQALKIYDELGRGDATMGSSSRNEAAELRRALLEKYPQLAASNPPPAAATAPALNPTNLIKKALETKSTATNAAGARK